MKPYTLRKNLLPKLSTSLVAISLFVLVACNESTAEQAKTEDTVQNSESATKTVNTDVQQAIKTTEPENKEVKVDVEQTTKAAEPAEAKVVIEQTAEPAKAEVKASVEQTVKTPEPTKGTVDVQQAAKTDTIVVAETTRSNQKNSNVATTPKAPKFVEGKHYFEIFPQINPDAPAGKVEVLELMWLGCPHCYKLEKHVEQYKKNKADYVAFKQIPAMLNRVWSKDAETFYMAQLLDPTGEKKLISKIFHAIHEQGRRFKNEDSVKRYFAQLGINETEYDKVKNSMVFKPILHRARQISEASQISSVPSFIVNGKYRTSASTAGGEKKLFQLIEMLSAKEKK
jgi:thiol:disulfide interchange protein DsbA